MVNQIFFYLFAVIILTGAVFTITTRNAVHSAIFLIMTLIGVAGLYLHLLAEFLAAVQIILYVGGIMVLFLFVIMLVNLDQAAVQPRGSPPLGARGPAGGGRRRGPPGTGATLVTQCGTRPVGACRLER